MVRQFRILADRRPGRIPRSKHSRAGPRLARVRRDLTELRGLRYDSGGGSGWWPGVLVLPSIKQATPCPGVQRPLGAFYSRPGAPR